MNIKTTAPDNFVWYLLEPSVARTLHNADYPVYMLYEDGSECLCQEDHRFEAVDVQYGIEEPDHHIVHAICGATGVTSFENGDIYKCFDDIFHYKTSDMVFFSANEKPSKVINALSRCQMVTTLTPKQFLHLVTLA